MSGLPKRYLFQNVAQWGAGVVTGGHAGADGLAPAARLAAMPARVWEGEAHAPAASRDGEVYWRDGTGALYWLSDSDQTDVCGGAAGANGFGGLQRLVATTGFFWAANDGMASIGMFERRSLQPVAEVVASGMVKDIAWAERRAVAALVQSAGGTELLRIDERRRTSDIVIPKLNADAFLVARAANRWIVAEPARLRWADADNPSAGWADLPLTSLGLGAGLSVALLAAFPPIGVLLVCSTGQQTAPHLFVLGPEGEVLGDAAVPAEVGALYGIAGAGSRIWLASAPGLWRWDLAAGAGETSFVTPALRSPLGQESGWLRAEIAAILPPGATIACQIASTGDPTVAQTAQAVLANPGFASAAKAAALDALLDWGDPIQIATGQDGVGPNAVPAVPTPWVLSLHSVADEFLWLKLRVADSVGERTSQISSLTVLYPELSLMRRLPAIYRATPSAHLRGLVALLDVMAQGLDRRIATLGKLVDPASTPDDWLNYLASWLGLPWEDGLPAATRRAMLEAAPELLAELGTAQGVRRLIGVLLPERPVRISDAAALAPALLPQSGEGGGTMPVVLLGRRQDATRLNVAVLGHCRLRACEQDDDPLLRLSGWLLIEVSATTAERAALAAPLARLLAGYLPAGLEPVLRWQLWPSGTGRRLDQDLSLLGERPGLLGQDVRLGGVTLGGTGSPLRQGFDFFDSERLL
jgi:phage tail-like protein